MTIRALFALLLSLAALVTAAGQRPFAAFRSVLAFLSPRPS
jgi:hypothetical protein